MANSVTMEMREDELGLNHHIGPISDIDIEKEVSLELLPRKSKNLYEKKYEEFMDWCTRKGVKKGSENVMLTYFSLKAKSTKHARIRRRREAKKLQLKYRLEGLSRLCVRRITDQQKHRSSQNNGVEDFYTGGLRRRLMGVSTKEREAEGTVARGVAEEELARKAMGDYGRWQLGIILMLSGLKLPIAWAQLGIVFLAAPLPFHCNNGTQTCVTDQGEECHSWVYDRSVFSETIISEWDLVCGRHQLVNVTQMVLMVGILVGNIIFSIAADRFGRKSPLVLAGMLQMLTGVCASFTPWFSAFLVLRFLQAVATGGMMTISFVLCVEILSGQMRTTVTTLSHIPFNIGHEMMVGIAYFIRDWRHFQLAISLPSGLIITFLWLVPESPRWLMAVGRYDEALVVLRKAAAVNNNTMPADVTLAKTEKQKMEMSEEKKANILDLLRTPNMRKKTLAMSFNWMACGLCFYGLAQYVSTIGGNIFVNVALAGSFVVPGMLVTLYTLDKFGRKSTLIGGQFLAALCCFLIIFFPEAPGKSDFPRVALASLGILGMGISFPTAYLYSGELFPTVVRNVGVGSGSMSARIGSMVAPFVASLNYYGEMLPPLMFSLIPLAAGLLGLLLPETRNTQLPNTLEEGELFGKNNKPSARNQINNLDGVKNEAYQNDHQA